MNKILAEIMDDLGLVYLGNTGEGLVGIVAAGVVVSSDDGEPRSVPSGSNGPDTPTGTSTSTSTGT